MKYLRLLLFILVPILSTPTLSLSAPTEEPLVYVYNGHKLTNEQALHYKLIKDSLPEFMIDTLWCESTFRQFSGKGASKSSVLVSPTNDMGLAQINLPTWQNKAYEMGLDLSTATGSIAMAQHILDVQGPTAWTCYRKLFM